jgi:hypothetical protein
MVAYQFPTGMKTAPEMSGGRFGSSGNRIRTCDLWVMSYAPAIFPCPCGLKSAGQRPSGVWLVAPHRTDSGRFYRAQAPVAGGCNCHTIAFTWAMGGPGAEMAYSAMADGPVGPRSARPIHPEMRRTATLATPSARIRFSTQLLALFDQSARWAFVNVVEDQRPHSGTRSVRSQHGAGRPWTHVLRPPEPTPEQGGKRRGHE